MALIAHFGAFGPLVASARALYRAGRRLHRLADYRLGHEGQVLPGAQAAAGLGERESRSPARSASIRSSLGILAVVPGLCGADLLVVLLARRALPRSLQAPARTSRAQAHAVAATILPAWAVQKLQTRVRALWRAGGRLLHAGDRGAARADLPFSPRAPRRNGRGGGRHDCGGVLRLRLWSRASSPGSSFSRRTAGWWPRRARGRTRCCSEIAAHSRTDAALRQSQEERKAANLAKSALRGGPEPRVCAPRSTPCSATPQDSRDAPRRCPSTAKGSIQVIRRSAGAPGRA